MTKVHDPKGRLLGELAGTLPPPDWGDVTLVVNPPPLSEQRAGADVDLGRRFKLRYEGEGEKRRLVADREAARLLVGHPLFTAAEG